MKVQRVMVTRNASVATVLILLAAFSISAAPPPASVTLRISGMYCDGCAEGIKAMLKRTRGVVNADVSFERKEAVVAYQKAMTSPGEIARSVERMGYKVLARK